jgi:hypothetical protein
MMHLGAGTKVVESVPRLCIADVINGLGRDKTGTLAITALVAGEPFAAEVKVVTDPFGRRRLLCPCGLRRLNLHVFKGKLGCRTCLHLSYWEQAAIPKAKWRQEVARPALRAHRKALATASKVSAWPKAQNAR